MIITPKKFLEKIIKLAEKNNEIAVLWLYGSRADNTYHAQSDFDLAIAFTHFLTDPLQNRLRPELLAIEWTSILKCPENLISIVDINIIPTTLAWEVVTKGKSIVVKEASRLLKEQSRIYSQYELDVSYHRKHYG
jgi:predicted nucleotidyltransferase